MAFQIPLMRNDYDIYKMNQAAKSRPIATSKKNNGRSRNVSESHSYSTSPGQNDPFIGSPSHRNLQHVHSAAGRFNHNFSRVNSRTSQSSLIISPTRSHSINNTSPPKPAKSGSQTSLNKFHTRLVDKLRKAFKSSSSEESSTRSWKSHSIDLSSPFRRPSSEVNRKLVSASSAEIAALERQFQLIQTDSEDENDDVSSDSDEKLHQNHCDDKFILIWARTSKLISWQYSPTVKSLSESWTDEKDL
jgi:hypothetical protein